MGETITLSRREIVPLSSTLVRMQNIQWSDGENNVDDWLTLRSEVRDMVANAAANNLSTSLVRAASRNGQIIPLEEMTSITDMDPDQELTLYFQHLFVYNEPKIANKIQSPKDLIVARKQELAIAFHQQYYGSGVQYFIEGLDAYEKMYNANSNYGRSIPILQSSGTGKSRLVAEVLKQEPGLSLCFRTSNDPEQGWPLRDEAMCQLADSKDYLGEEIAAVLLGTLFEETLKQLGGANDAETLMLAWSLDSEQNRAAILESVKASATAKLVNMPKSLAERRVTIVTETKPDVIETWRTSLYRAFCLEPAKKLAKKLKSLHPKQKRFIIAFDECTNMSPGYRPRRASDAQSDNKGTFVLPVFGMTLLAVQRMVKAQDQFSDLIPDFSFWFLFLDTNSIIADFYPSRAQIWSHRLTRLIPLSPWPYVGFDVMASSPATTPKEALSFSHLMQYGRPYWSTFASSHLLVGACRKLYPSQGTINTGSIDHVLATFSQRFPLELAPNEAGGLLAAEGVRGYMRILMGVIDRSFVATVTPSEPSLAIAAMAELQRDKTTYKNALATFVDQLLKGLILERGYQGELFSRLLLTLARDRSFKFPSGLTTVPTTSAEVFLTTLLSPTLGLQDTEESQALRDTFLDTMRKAHINFTHIVQLPEDIGSISPTFLQKAWCRGAAFQCSFNQPCIDGFIVTYNGDLTLPFDLKKFGYIAWQSKLREEATSTDLAERLAGPVIVDNSESWKPDSGVVLLMDMGTTSRFADPGTRCKLSYEPAKLPPSGRKGRWSGYMATQETEPSRWCLQAREHSPETYPQITDHRDQFKILFDRSLQYTDSLLTRFAHQMEQALTPFLFFSFSLCILGFPEL